MTGITRVSAAAIGLMALAGGATLLGAQGRMGGGPGFQQTIELVKQFDKNGDKVLDAAERKAALEYLNAGGGAGGGRTGPGFGGRGPGGFGRGGDLGPATPGPKLTPKDVTTAPATPFYDAATLRTLFLNFEDANWESELMAFKNTDVEVPATLVADGKTYKDVGIKFHGMSSFMMVPEGRKHSINVSMDLMHDQSIGGYRTLNLLNSHEDASFLRAVLFNLVASDYLKAPKANFMRVSINDENWGIYANVQQFNKDALKEWYGTTDGVRWKVPGSPGGRGGLEYRGDDASAYKGTFEIKSKDNPKAWADLVNLCKVLNTTPTEKLESALAPILDIDETLRFLALEVALVNNDGYWVRASDYSLYQDVKGRFHLIPKDTNETFSTEVGGPGGRGGPGGPGGRPGRGGMPPDMMGPPGGMGPDGRGMGPDGRGGRGGGMGMMGGSPTLDPLVGLTDASKPLRSKLLAVPALREKYLGYVRDIATKWLDWNKLGPIAEKYHALIAADVKVDTRKLDTNAAFDASLADLKSFADQRRAFLLK